MEEQTSQDPKIPQSTSPIEPAQAKKDPFSIVGKIAIALIIIAALVGGGILFGKNLNKSDQTTQETKKETRTPEPTKTEESISPTSAPAVETKTVSGGLGTDATVFKAYTITIPDKWIASEEKTEIGSNLVLEKGEYSIQIYQAPMGGGFCIYPNENEEGFKTQYDFFKEFTGKNNEVYRRSWDGESATNYTICQKGTEDTFQVHTIYGSITVNTPSPAEENILAEIDSIIATLEEK